MKTLIFAGLQYGVDKGIFAFWYFGIFVPVYLRLKTQVKICRPFRSENGIFALLYLYIFASLYFGIFAL